MKNQTWLVDVKESEDGELYIELPADAMSQAGIEIGDELTITENPITHDIHLVKLIPTAIEGSMKPEVAKK